MTAIAPARTEFTTAVNRLSRRSVDRHFDAYADIDWDAPELAIDPEDTRFSLWPDDPLAETAWYRSLPPERRARLACHRVATAMRIGWEFENVLQRGLLEQAFWMDGRRPELRYLQHEIAEECQHQLMFQEFVNRTGLDIDGMPRPIKVASRFVVGLSRRFPEAFMLFVLAGEDPVDYMQRRQLRRGERHPAVERIMRIHVLEEARHIAFARHFLHYRVPRLSRGRRRALALLAPLIFGGMGRLMAFPTPSTVRKFGVPRHELRVALRSATGRRLLRDVVSGPRKLCGDLGLMTPAARSLWRLVGMWDDGPAPTAELARC
jgi:hypothetical protein